MFLNPLMLLGAGAISVPIIIHLLNKRKFEKVRWAAMRFLRSSIEQNQRRLRIEDILLLILRCLIIGLLALALARPAIRSTAAGLFGQAGVTAVIVIDSSASMSQTDGVTSRFDRAKDAAEQILASLPSGSSAAVWLASDAVRPLVPEPTFDLNLARQQIRDARRSDRSSDLFPAVRRAVELLNQSPSVRRELYVITDAQRSAFRQSADMLPLLEAEKDTIRPHLVFIDQPETENLSVSDLRQATGIAAIDQPLRFVAQVTNYGQNEARDVRVSLRISPPAGADRAAAQPPVDEAMIDSIPPGASRSVSLFGRLREEGWHSVSASIAPDRVPADDVRSLVVRGVRQVKVLIVDGQPGREPRDAESFYLLNALVPVTPAQRAAHFVSATVVDGAGFRATSLDDFDVVVIANVTDFADASVDALASYVARGGGLLVFPGSSVQRAFYNDKLASQRRLLPGLLGDPKGDPASETPVATLSDRALDHPIASLWKDPAAGSIGAARFYRIFPITPLQRQTNNAGPAVGEPNVVLRFADQSPAVIEHSYGQGRVVLFSSTVDTEWNDLPVRPGVFVPLMYRTLGAIVQRQDEAMNLPAGDRLAWRTPSDWLGRDALVRPPGDDDGSLRDARRVELVDQSPMLVVDDTDVAGVYEVTLPDAPPIRFAVAARAEESSLDTIADPDVEQLATVAEVIRFENGEALVASIEQQRVGTELWSTIAMLVVALAAAEMVMAHRFSQAK